MQIYLFLILGLVLIGVVFLLVKGFRYLLYIIASIGLLIGIMLTFGLNGIEFIPIGVGLLFNSGILLVIADALSKIIQHEKMIDEIKNRLDKIQRKVDKFE